MRELANIAKTSRSGRLTTVPIKTPDNPVNLWATLDIDDADLARLPNVKVVLGIEFFLNDAWRGARITRTLNRGLRGREKNVSVSAPSWEIGGEKVDLSGLDCRLVLEVIGGDVSVGVRLTEGV